MKEPAVAVLGLGIMGRALAENLAEDGVLAATWSRTAKTDAPAFETDIKAAVAKANILLIVVSDGTAVSAVVDLIEPHLVAGHIVVNCATVSPDENRPLNERIKTTGAAFCEALMGGSKLAAVNRKLPFYLGGEKAVIDKVTPVLEPLSSICIHVGEVGTASVAKLAMNLNLAMQVEALCESYAYAISNGLTDDQYFTVLRHNTGWNYLCEYKEPKLRARDYDPQFSVKNMLKDVRLALDTDKTKAGLSLLKKTESIYATGEEQGFGDEDMVALLKLIQPD